MLYLTEALLKGAGFKYDEIEEAWVAGGPLRPVVTVEWDEDYAYLREALVEVHAVVKAAGYTYRNFAINGQFISIVGLTKAYVAAVA